MKIAPLFHQLKMASWAARCSSIPASITTRKCRTCSGDELGLPSPDLHLGVGPGAMPSRPPASCWPMRRSARAPAGLGRRGRRRQRDRRLRARRKKTVPAARPSRSGAAQRRPDDAGRNQPARHRRHRRSAVDAVARRRRQSAGAKAWRPRRSNCVGNIMIDSFEMLRRPIAERRYGRSLAWPKAATRSSQCTARPMSMIRRCCRPSSRRFRRSRTGCRWCFRCIREPAAALTEFGLMDRLGRVMVDRAAGLYRIHELGSGARLVITDSGGVQEETTYLGIPCLTVRDTTERPITISEGTNRLVPIPISSARSRGCSAGDGRARDRPRYGMGRPRSGSSPR